MRSRQTFLHCPKADYRNLVQSFNMPCGAILVLTVEATTVDLVGYEHIVGGLDQVTTLLCELAEKIDPKTLA